MTLSQLKIFFVGIMLVTTSLGTAHMSLAKFDEALSTEELKELQGKLSKRQDLSIDFQQIRTSALRPKRPSKSSGKALFAKPSKFRWEILKPQSDVLIFDGSNLFSYKPGETTATKYRTQGERASEIKEVIDFVMDFDALLKRYQLNEATRSGHEIFLKLKPKSEGALSGIDITVDAKNYFVRSLKMTFINKNTSEFIFSNPEIGRVDAKSFVVPSSFKIVEGV